MIAFERLLAVMIKPWVVVGCVVLIILSIMYLDQPIAHFFHGLDPSTSIPILNLITKLGLGGIYLVPLILLALFFRYVYKNRKWEQRALFLWLCVLFSSIVCVFLKMVLGRARPGLLFSDQLYGVYGFHTQADFWSFPSGHTSTVMSLAFGLCVIFPRYFYAFIALGLFLVSSRVMLTNHYLSDVMAASYLALLEVGLLLWCSRRKQLLTQGLPS